MTPCVLVITRKATTVLHRTPVPPEYRAVLVDVHGNEFHELRGGVQQEPVLREAERWATALGLPLMQRTDTVIESLQQGEMCECSSRYY